MSRLCIQGRLIFLHVGAVVLIIALMRHGGVTSIVLGHRFRCWGELRRTMDLNKRFGLAGKSALVTGASSGLGRHFAEVLAGAGAQVALAARRMDLLNHAAEEIRGVGGKAVALELDVSQGAAVAQAFDVAEAEIGAIDIVINNAGVASESWFVETSEEEWRRTMDVNLDGVYRVGREAAQRMKAAGGGGSIINVASVLGLRVMPGLSSYAVSKAAVVQLTKSMALELARDNIRVNAIAPGYFPTEMNEDFLVSPDGKRLLSRMPMPRAGNLGEIDGTVLLLASDAGSFMTGSIISVDGGATLTMG